MPEFDLALTYERFEHAKGTPGDRRLVASQRFYQFWLTHKLKMDWVPVRIDPD